MDGALIADAPTPDETERPATKPEITPEIVKENLRRVKAGAANTLIRVLPDGRREYHEDRIVREGDGRIDTLRTDIGEGTPDSLKLLAKDGFVAVHKVVPGQKRDGSGRFTK